VKDFNEEQDSRKEKHLESELASEYREGQAYFSDRKLAVLDKVFQFLSGELPQKHKLHQFAEQDKHRECKIAHDKNVDFVGRQVDGGRIKLLAMLHCIVDCGNSNQHRQQNVGTKLGHLAWKQRRYFSTSSKTNL